MECIKSHVQFSKCTAHYIQMPIKTAMWSFPTLPNLFALFFALKKKCTKHEFHLLKTSCFHAKQRPRHCHYLGFFGLAWRTNAFFLFIQRMKWFCAKIEHTSETDLLMFAISVTLLQVWSFFRVEFYHNIKFHHFSITNEQIFGFQIKILSVSSNGIEFLSNW